MSFNALKKLSRKGAASDVTEGDEGAEIFLDVRVSVITWASSPRNDRCKTLTHRRTDRRKDDGKVITYRPPRLYAM